MVSYPNGQIPSSALTTVATGVQLLNSCAIAFRTWRLMASLEGIRVSPAPGVGSGYRSLAVQKLFWAASHGDKAASVKVGLSATSTVSIAVPGTSSHGDGRKIDALMSGREKPTAQELTLAGHYGWTRQFGAADDDHYAHDGKTAISGPTDEEFARVVAAYLNNRHLGRTTDTAKDGQRDLSGQVAQNYWWLIQHAGHLDKVYPTWCLEDGKTGPHSKAAEAHYRKVLWNAA